MRQVIKEKGNKDRFIIYRRIYVVLLKACDLKYIGALLLNYREWAELFLNGQNKLRLRVWSNCERAGCELWLEVAF